MARGWGAERLETWVDMKYLLLLVPWQFFRIPSRRDTKTLAGGRRTAAHPRILFRPELVVAAGTSNASNSRCFSINRSKLVPSGYNRGHPQMRFVLVCKVVLLMYLIACLSHKAWLRCLLVYSLVWMGASSESYAQATVSQNGPSASSSETPRVDASTLQELVDSANAPKPTNETISPGMDFMSLLVKGGIFMIPIGFVSLLVVMFIFERLIGLRRGKLIPSAFVRKIRQLSHESGSIDPRIAYGYCSEYPSATSNVVRAVLLRVGRPQSEVESAAAEVSQREADKAFGGVRWLNFCAGVAPLLGLLGTVWGLIRAFHDLTLLGPTENRADFLGRGVYEALVTTLAGLVVAIPAALAAHFFEGRILRVFRSIEELVFSLIPKLERYEGRIRFDPIGRELVARNIELSKKPTSQSTEAAKPIAPPPVQNAATQTSPPHSSSSVPARKSTYKS